MRSDINMPVGKIAAQAAHCCAQSLISYLSLYPEQIDIFRDLGKSGSRIILKAKNLNQILASYNAAKN